METLNDLEKLLLASFRSVLAGARKTEMGASGVGIVNAHKVVDLVRIDVQPASLARGENPNAGATGA